MPPVKPMLAKSVAKIPPDMQYEAKWDGFRAIVFRDGDEAEPRQSYGKAADQVLSRAGDGGEGTAAGAVRAGRRNRDRAGGAAGLRRADRAHPPGRLPGPDARREDAGVARGLRPARAGGRVAARRASDRPARPPGQGAGRCHGAGPCGAGDDRHRRGAAVVRAVRGGRPGRCHRQAAHPALSPGPARHVQDQARAHGGRRRRRLPPPQERPDRGLTAARPLRRPGDPATCRGVGRVRDEAARGAGGGAGAAAPSGRLGPPLGGLVRGGCARDGPAARRSQPLVGQEGPVLGAAQAGAGGRGGVRPHGERGSFPAHGALPPLASGPDPESCTYAQLEEPVRYDLDEILNSPA